MALIDLERAVLSICFRAQPPEQHLAELGERRSWLMYREMVRDRLLAEIRAALPRSRQLLGDAALLEAFTLFLERDPPRTRFFREIVLAFVHSALPVWEADASIAKPCLDMLRYEAALWQVRDLEATLAEPCLDFAFDRVPVVCPALRLLRVAHAVHLKADGEGRYAAGQHRLCVHRANDTDSVRTWTLTETTFELLQRWQRGGCTLAQSVQQLGQARAVSIDAAFVDALCTTLAQFIEIGIVLGSR
jgi:hypothetical protein